MFIFVSVTLKLKDMKLNNNQKKLLKELTKISLKKGYWSDDVRRFNSKLDFTTMNLINNHYLNK